MIGVSVEVRDTGFLYLFPIISQHLPESLSDATPKIVDQSQIVVSVEGRPTNIRMGFAFHIENEFGSPIIPNH